MKKQEKQIFLKQIGKTGSIFMKKINKFQKFKSIGEYSLIIMQK